MTINVEEQRATFAPLAVTALALGLRLFRLDAQGAWVDEAFTIHASVSSWDEMMRILVGDFNHPPLHTILVRGWFDLFGAGVTQARLLSVVAGTLAVPTLYWLGRLIFDRSTALLASLLLSGSQLGIIYSQEARGYALLLLLAIGSSGFFLKAFRTGRVRDFALFVTLTALALYTHYYAIFIVAGVLVYALVYRKRSAIPIWWWAVGLLAIVIVYLPWLTSGVVASALRDPGGAIVSGVAAQLASPIYAINWFNNGKVAGVRSATPVWAFALGLMVFTGPALYAIWRLRASSERDRASAMFLVISTAVPIFAVSILGLLRVVYDVRHVAFAAAPYYLLVARGVTMAPSDHLRRLAMVALVVCSVLSFRTDYFIPYKENYRDALQVMANEVREGDCTVFGAPDDDSFGYLYWSAHRPGETPPSLIRLDEARSRSDCARIWLLWDQTFWKAGPSTFESTSQTIGGAYRARAPRSFIGVDLYLFERTTD